jgi:alpha-tubulin suppressor-like RCC1 family protein
MGELGDGTITDRVVATQILVDVRDVASATQHTCVLAGDTVSCFGNNGDGQLGDGTQTSRLTPAPVVVSLGGLALANVVAVGAGDAHACALQDSGIVWCWGSNKRRQLGAGTSTPLRSTTPVRVALSGSAVQVAVGNHHACALTVDGAVLCWGWNSFGQLGVGTTSDSAVPLAVDLDCQ